MWSLQARSASFRRFCAASTSALSSFCDFAFGDSTMLDHNFSYPRSAGCLKKDGENLFAVLKQRGYETLGLMRASPRPAYAENGFWGAWPAECGDFRCYEDSEGVCSDAENFLAQSAAAGKPFALYFTERAARLDDRHAEKMAQGALHSRVEKGYAILDRSADRVFRKLRDLRLLADTVVAVFGSYGTDPWKHGIAMGRAHGLAPYADLPLFLYRNDAGSGVSDNLVSMVDLKPTLLRLLFPGERIARPGNIGNCGIDIFSDKRGAAFSQNLFALEEENAGTSRGLAKSYAVVHEEERLIVSSDCGVSGDGGMELYFDLRDPGNTRNFLDFFTLDSGGFITAFGKPEIVHVHFTLSFKQHMVMNMVEKYNFLRENLFGHIREKEGRALAELRRDAGGSVFSDNMFRRKRRRQ